MGAWNIHEQWFPSETVWKVGRHFNRCHNVIIRKTGSKKGRYVKMLVDINLTKPLIRGSKIRCEGEMKWISFKYEMLPNFLFLLR